MQPDDPEGRSAEDLAREQEEAEATKNDPLRLLPGEDPQSPYREDAEHWVEVYRELVETKSAILAKLREERRGLGRESQAELSHDDRILQLELERLRVRLATWEQRLRQSG
ncbi:MAG TPA: hypothetical protein VFA92_04550 [Candidatus Binatia bacterium]|jgi:hypothetical protein|nr:hypothetical protein [Candidatus Binatia bacterium]